jgi:hypothetical protein
MANYAINITDNGGDQWTFAVLKAPTLASGGSALTNGATTAGNLHVAVQKAVEAVKDDVSLNGHL